MNPPSQIILISLVAQLQNDLHVDSRTKLTWLKHALQLLKPTDPHIAPNAPRILRFMPRLPSPRLPPLAFPPLAFPPLPRSPLLCLCGSPFLALCLPLFLSPSRSPSHPALRSGVRARLSECSERLGDDMASEIAMLSRMVDKLSPR